mmetsp:Transcript_2526/g.3210  ORF Transcript_2526/g.3210 Transcript_2526/m.3210 type:complete len:115 (+) Transcript_2526:199-543(+)
MAPYGNTVGLAGFLGATAILAGAFGAHGLKQRGVEENLVKAWETGAHYQLAHAVVILALPKTKRSGLTTTLFVAGTLLFSGSLYLMVLTGNRKLGIVTPVGGVSLALAWFSLMF